VKLIFPREIVDLPTGGSKRLFDRHLDMFVPCIVRWRMIDDNVLVRGNCNPDADLEAGAVLMLVARRDHSNAAPDDMVIVLFQPLCFTFDFGAHSLRRLASFEGHLQWGLHNGLSVFMAVRAGKRRTGRKSCNLQSSR
jgi:hypothetical protein